MLVDKLPKQTKTFKELFEKKFRSFCSKNILTLDYVILGDRVSITDYSGLMTTPLVYIFRGVDETQAIYEISLELEKYYPKFHSYVVEQYSNEEVKEMLLNGKTIEEIDRLLPKYKEVLDYTILKVVHYRNELLVMNHTKHRKESVGLTMPVKKFIDILYRDVDEAYRIFKQKILYVEALK